MLESRNVPVPIYKGPSVSPNIPTTGGKSMSFDPYSAGIQSVGQVWSSKVQAKTARKSSESQERIAREAARLQGKIATDQLKFVTGEAANLRADTEIARRGNFDLSQVDDRNVGSRFNIGNQLNASSFNANAANQRGEFNATRGDSNARYDALANDRSNLRAMLNGPGWDPAAFAEVDALERVTAEKYTPEEAAYVKGYVPPNNA